jgi:FtsP/CotA-like multicopper oxidase with cupredoxin domain
LYWYHPHVREDVTQELGLYGNVLVEPADPDYWPPADRDVVLTVDDVLLEGGAIAPFSRTETNYAAMGRYGNVMLTGGQTEPALTVRTGEVVRLWLTNTANTRVFRVAVPGARMKLIGGDSGRMERAEFVGDVVLAPSERAVVDVLFDRAGDFALESTARPSGPTGWRRSRSPARRPSRRPRGRSRSCAAHRNSWRSASSSGPGWLAPRTRCSPSSPRWPLRPPTTGWATGWATT